MLALDAAHPPLSIAWSTGWNMQSFTYGSVCTTTSEIPGTVVRTRSSTTLAR